MAKLHQKKSLGQVFLKSRAPCVFIADKLKTHNVSRILEIGGGGGVLTEELAALGLPLTVVEKDDRFAKLLEDKFQEQEFRVVNEDILAFALEDWVVGGGGAVVGNIPYNISTYIIKKILQCLNELSVSYLMTQKEFAQRLAAHPGTKSYGSLSVFVQLRSEIKLVLDVDRKLFKPVPRVDSAILELKPKTIDFNNKQLRKIETIVRTSFANRRKKLRNSVKALIRDAEISIDLDRRPETLSIEEFVVLTKEIYADSW